MKEVPNLVVFVLRIARNKEELMWIDSPQSKSESVNTQTWSSSCPSTSNGNEGKFRQTLRLNGLSSSRMKWKENNVSNIVCTYVFNYDDLSPYVLVTVD